MSANRIRVLIAGNVYVKRALVRRFLEDDGYEVVGDVMAASAVMPAIRAGRPDAIVIDEDLVRGGTPIAAIRDAAPDARVVVFTAAAPGAGAPPPGADGYLDKGVGLSALTALLGRLFAEPTAPLEPQLVAAGAGAVAAAVTDTTEGPMEDTQLTEPTNPAPRQEGGSGASLARWVAIAAGALLIVWGVVSAIDTDDSGGATETVAEGVTTTTDTGGDAVTEEEPTPLDEAYASLDSMITALEDGNYILASIEAQSLMEEREAALAAGFATTGFDAEVTARLEPLVPTLPLRVNEQLADILGSLYPPFETESEPKGDDGTQVLGETVENDGGTSTGGDQTGDTGGDNGGGGGGGGGEEPAPQPGDGKVWGHSHKPPKGGWHGNKPPK